MSETEKQKYKEEFDQRQENLKKLVRAMEATTARALTAANRLYAKAEEERDAFKAGERLIKTGAHVQAQTGFKGVSEIARISKQFDESYVLREYLNESDEEE